MFSKDKTGSDQAKQCWVKEVKKATTVSRLHLLLGILDSMVIWDLSAENAVSILPFFLLCVLMQLNAI